MRTMIYDCEIKSCIQGRGQKRDPSLRYCGGWRDFAGMGVSVTGAIVMDWPAQPGGAPRVFMDDNALDLVETANSCDLLVGFNNEAFDDPLLAATYPAWTDTMDVPRYDLLRELWRAHGLKSTWGGPSTHGGFGLDATCAENFATGKSGHGAQAPVDWQQGRVGNVVDYCLTDVWLTYRLFLLALSGMPVMSPKDPGRSVTLRGVGEVASGFDPSAPWPSNERKPDPSGDVQELRFPAEEPREPQYYDWSELEVGFEPVAGSDSVRVEVLANDGPAVPATTVSRLVWMEQVSEAIVAKDSAALIRGLREERARQGLPRFTNEE